MITLDGYAASDDVSDASLGHHLNEVTGTEFEHQIPPDAQDDDFVVEMSTPEEILC